MENIIYIIVVDYISIRMEEIMTKKKKNIFEETELNSFPLVEKPDKNNTLVDLTLFDKLTFTPLKKIKKMPTKKALEELDEVLDNKG